MKNINKLVWDYIDQRIEIKKTLVNGLLNSSALARQVAESCGLENNIDAIISAIRRYSSNVESSFNQHEKVYSFVKNSKVSTKTGLASLLIRRNDHTESRIGSLYSKVELGRNTTLRIFEVSNYIKIIVDSELLSKVKDVFDVKSVVAVETRLGELTINYEDDITKTPGVFAALSNELAMNDISIIDSMICHQEHLIIVNEKDLERSFRVLFNLSSNTALKN